jgi:hypothetical protein
VPAISWRSCPASLLGLKLASVVIPAKAEWAPESWARVRLEDVPQLDLDERLADELRDERPNYDS